MSTAEFKRIVWAHYKKYGRHNLPWRPPSLKLREGKEDNVAYRILVSEVMLQQTQVDRVVPYYRAFMKRFPTAKQLAAAPLTEVLQVWQGLGYNRRAKMLHQAAKTLAVEKARTVAEWEALPGVGPYTARAVAAFAYNEDVIFIETNIRTAIIHHFFSHKKQVSDKAIEKILIEMFPKGRAREWYSALMDYGAHLKRSGISHNAKSKTYTKQKKFSGSLREARGALVRAYTSGERSRAKLTALLGTSRRAQMREALEALLREGLIEVRP